MRYEKIADAEGNLHLTCVKSDGKEVTIDVAANPPPGRRQKLRSAEEILSIPTPFCHKRPNAFYWYEYLADTHTLYLRYQPECR